MLCFDTRYYRISSEVFRGPHNYLLLGGAAYNELVRGMPARTFYPYELSLSEEDEGHAKFVCHDIKSKYRELECKEQSYDTSGHHRVSRDFGLIARIPNPKDPGNTILVLAGIHMHGTLAASEMLLTRAFGRRLALNLYPKYFVQLVRAEVDQETGMSLTRIAMEGKLYRVKQISES